MNENYVSPDVNCELTEDEIHLRYQDTAMVIFKDQQRNQETKNFLTFGSSRRTIEYSNYGNQPVIIRRPLEVNRINNVNLMSHVRKIYHKPRENCTIS